MGSRFLGMGLAVLLGAVPALAGDFTHIEYNNAGLVVDLGVGLWAQPLPMDYDNDGDNDLVVATADKPYNGTYFFENTEGDVTFPTFKAGVRVDDAVHNMTLSYVNDFPLVTIPGELCQDFRREGLAKRGDLPFKPLFHQGRAKQWRIADYDGDGDSDLVIGTSDWREYGWDQAFNDKGEWTNGPLHGYVYFVENKGSDVKPEMAEAVQLLAAGQPIDVYGCPSPNFVDWDQDGDFDLVLGEFLDRMTYFENTGTRKAPEYAAGVRLKHAGEDIRMELEMLQVVAFDWDNDGDADLVVGEEDGRVSLIAFTWMGDDGQPTFEAPRYFKQEARYLKVGVLSTPFAYDWDNDGDQDLLVGDSAGFISFAENLGGGATPSWAPPVRLEAGGETIRIQAGPNGSVQGPAEAKWGYTVLNVADWDQDGLPDIVANSIWGKVIWYRNVGELGAPKLAKAEDITVEWPGETPKPAWFWWKPEGKQLVTQWRTTPYIMDLNTDGLNDLIMLDTEGYLCFYERAKRGDALVLLPPVRIFEDEEGNPLRMNEREGGKSGRRKFAFADWDGDGRLDLLANSVNIDFMRNVGTTEHPWRFKNEGPVSEQTLAGHTTCPTVVDWNGDGRPDLLTGAEDGHFYYLENPK